MMIISKILYLTILFPVIYAAQVENINLKMDRCIGRTSSTSEQRKCINDAEADWDKNMNYYYKLLLNKLPEKSKNNLRDSQRKWMAFRDSEFKMINDYFFNLKNGTIFHVIADQKRMEIIKQRTNELQAYYEILDK